MCLPALPCKPPNIPLPPPSNTSNSTCAQTRKNPAHPGTYASMKIARDDGHSEDIVDEGGSKKRKARDWGGFFGHVGDIFDRAIQQRAEEANNAAKNKNGNDASSSNSSTTTSSRRVGRGGYGMIEISISVRMAYLHRSLSCPALQSALIDMYLTGMLYIY